MEVASLTADRGEKTLSSWDAPTEHIICLWSALSYRLLLVSKQLVIKKADLINGFSTTIIFFY